MGVFLRSAFAHVDNVIPVIKAITWLLLSRLQGNKPHRNFPEPSEPYLLNLRQHTPEPSEIFRNLPELACGTYTILHRNSPEPSGTCLRNLHHFTKELSGTFWNPPPEPTPAHSGTFRNLPPEPAPATRTGTHRSLSGLKTPLAYAVGEKQYKNILSTMFSSCSIRSSFYVKQKSGQSRASQTKGLGGQELSLLGALQFFHHDLQLITGEPLNRLTGAKKKSGTLWTKKKAHIPVIKKQIK